MKTIGNKEVDTLQANDLAAPAATTHMVTIDDAGEFGHQAIPGGGGGGGDMEIATYDPQNIADDAFDRANHTGTQATSTITNLDTLIGDRPIYAEISDIGFTGSQDDSLDGTTYKKYSATDKTKLAGIEAAADVTDAANVSTSGGLIYINHGATSGTTRPSVSGAVYWIGTVEPTNAVDGDVWLDI